MSRGEDNGKMRYNVLDRNEKTIFSSVDQEEAQDFLRLNYDKLRAGEMEVASGGVDTVDVDEYAKMGDYPRDKEIEKKDKEKRKKKKFKGKHTTYSSVSPSSSNHDTTHKRQIIHIRAHTANTKQTHKHTHAHTHTYKITKKNNNNKNKHI